MWPQIFKTAAAASKQGQPKHARSIATQGPDAAAGWCFLVGAPQPRGAEGPCVWATLGCMSSLGSAPKQGTEAVWNSDCFMGDVTLPKVMFLIGKINKTHLFSIKLKLGLWFRKLNLGKSFKLISHKCSHFIVIQAETISTGTMFVVSLSRSIYSAAALCSFFSIKLPSSISFYFITGELHSEWAEL